MFVRRGPVAVRLGAVTPPRRRPALWDPAAAQAAPVPGEIVPMQGVEDCEDVAASVNVSASEVEVGETVTITASCFPGHRAVTGNVITPFGPFPLKGETSGGGSKSWNFTAEVDGEHAISLESGGVQGTGSFVVTGEAEEPTDPPTDPPTEEPTDPAPTDPEEPGRA